MKNKIEALVRYSNHTVYPMLMMNMDIITEDISKNIMQSVVDSHFSDFKPKNQFILKKSSLQDQILVRITKLQKQYIKTKTFAFPSNSMIFSLLALFSGKPKRIPGALKKAKTDRNTEEQSQVDNFIQSIISTDSSGYTYDSAGNTVPEIRKIALLNDNPKIKATASLMNLTLDEEPLAVYIRKTFGAEGLRHFLALIIGIEENSRKGYFEWTVNQHLERIGYQKKITGGFDTGQKNMAVAIVSLLSKLIIVASRKDHNKEIIRYQKLFSVVGGEIENVPGIHNEKIVIRAEDYWYSLGSTDRTRYTKLLKKIVKENHRDHPLTIMLVPLLAVFWRMQKNRIITVSNLMQWCSLDMSSNMWKRELRDMEDELEYMKQAGYLGDCRHDGEENFPSECKQPLNCTLILEPPNWLKKEFKAIVDKSESKQLKYKAERMTNKSFKQAYELSKLSVDDFADKIGVSKQMVYRILSRQRQVSNRLANQVKQLIQEI
jgi:hypothetical protein